MNSTHDDRGQSWWDVFPPEVVQVNVSLMYPGAIKGLHQHAYQTDYWFCAAGQLLVVLSQWPNDPKATRLFMRPGDLVPIQPGWWHGLRAIGGECAMLLYGVTRKYNPQEPDEARLPWDHFGREIWEMQPR